MKYAITLLLVALVSGCSSPAKIARSHPEFTPTYPVLTKPVPNDSGSIYQAGYSVALFEDEKARQVGDIILVRLSESTNASKSASAATSKASSSDSSVTAMLGRAITQNGIPILDAETSSEKDFEGTGDASQSNSLTGTIAVTVSEVLPNGYLMVRGEKLISLNQGDEYVRLSGIIRPQDIGSTNTVSSTQVANAQIIYGGEGVIANASTMGWMDRILQSPWWPF